MSFQEVFNKNKRALRGCTRDLWLADLWLGRVGWKSSQIASRNVEPLASTLVTKSWHVQILFTKFVPFFALAHFPCMMDENTFYDSLTGARCNLSSLMIWGHGIAVNNSRGPAISVYDTSAHPISRKLKRQILQCQFYGKAEVERRRRSDHRVCRLKQEVNQVVGQSLELGAAEWVVERIVSGTLPQNAAGTVKRKVQNWTQNTWVHDTMKTLGLSASVSWPTQSNQLGIN